MRPAVVDFAVIIQEELAGLVFFLALVSLIGWALAVMTVFFRLIAHFFYTPRAPLQQEPPFKTVGRRFMAKFSYAATQPTTRNIQEDPQGD